MSGTDRRTHGPQPDPDWGCDSKWLRGTMTLYAFVRTPSREYNVATGEADVTTINDISDLVRILREQPDWAEAVRGVLLSQELLKLPETFAEFAKATQARFDAVDQRFDAMDQRFDGIDQRFDGIDQRLDRMDQRFARIDGSLDNLGGPVYEEKIARNLSSYVNQHLALRLPDVLKGPQGTDRQFEIEAHDAVDQSRISQEELNTLLQADLIFTAWAHGRETPENVVAETGMTAADGDVNRAADRAGIMARLRQAPTRGVVFCSQVDDERRRKAREMDVSIVQIPY